VVLHEVPCPSQEFTQVNWEPQSCEQHPVEHEAPAAPHPPPESTGGVLPESGGVLPASGTITGQQELFFWPQLSRQLPPQPLGVQQAPLRQTPLFGHVCGQGTDSPQLSVTVTWHLPPHAVVSSGVQHVSLERQYSPEVHSVEFWTPQLTARLQLLSADAHCLPEHVVLGDSGMQPQTLL
jgi:hypothetical protein